MTEPTTQRLALGDGTHIAYRIEGAAGRPALVLSNSIGTTFRMWDDLMPELTRHFRVLRYDFRGHGQSDVPPGAYSLDRLGRDVIELMDGLAIDRAHFLGLSLGGFVGQWLGVHAPERLSRLVLSNTSPYLGPPEHWEPRIAAVRAASDMSETASTFLSNWFPEHMLEQPGLAVEKFRQMLLATHQQGLAGCWAAVRDADMRRTIALIDTPTLVIVGESDTVTAPSHGRQIASTNTGAQFLSLPAVHLPNVECPEDFLSAVLGFLCGGAQETQTSSRHDK
jgi:3-oxoadipate enol-lactonase